MLDPTRDPQGIMLVPGLTFIFIFMMVLADGASFFFSLSFFDDLYDYVNRSSFCYFTLYLILMCSYCMPTSWVVSMYL